MRSPPTEMPEFDPAAHHKVLDYLRRLWLGDDPDDAIENQSLADLRFNSLSLAELFFALSKEREIPIDRVVHFLRIGIPGGGDQQIATLIERIAILDGADLDENERDILLLTGVVGNGKEICPINTTFDSVGLIVKYCRAIESLKNLEDHDAIDATEGWVKKDPGWK